MPHFEFTISDLYLVYYAIRRSELLPDFPEWGSYIKRLKKNQPLGYKGIVSQLDPSWGYALTEAHTQKDSSRWLNHFAQESEKIFQEALRSHEYKRLKQETAIHLEEVKKEWRENGEKALTILHNMLRVPIPARKITVVVVHPDLRGGFSVGKGKNKKIIWGHQSEWQNYHTVYLCHELLHILLEWKDIPPNITHALIELATDNELRIRLQGGGQYFSVGEKSVGHPYLKSLEEEMLPFWKKHLRQKRETARLLARNFAEKSENAKRL